MNGYVRTYHALVRLLPWSVRSHDGHEMVQAFRDQLEHAPNPHATAWRAFCRYPVVLALEWRDAIVSGEIPTSPPPPRGSRMDAIARRLTQGSRALARTPAFSLTVVVLLGLGVGSVTAIFTVVDHVLLRRLPYPHAERLIGIGEGAHSIPAVRDFAAMRSVDTWAGAWTDESNLTGSGHPLRVRQAVVTEDFFPMFGARPALGRVLQPFDARGSRVIVLSYGLWMRAFGGDSGVVGRAIRINDVPMTVVGVVDGTFVLPEALVGSTVDVWRPLDPSDEYMTSRDYWQFMVAGRLRDGATIAQAQQEARAVATERARQFPNAYTARGQIIDLPVRAFDAVTTGRVEQPLKIFLGAVTLLLVVAGANVTHLFLARGIARLREIAVRRALGATTRSLVGQLLVESGLLGLAGAFLGAVIAWAGVLSFVNLAPDGLPRAATIGVDARFLFFAAGAGLVTAMVFGLLPALSLLRSSSGADLRGSGRTMTGSQRAQRLRSMLVVAEVAVSLVLVVQAGWLLRSFIRMQRAELGFQTAGIVTVPLTIPTPAATSDPKVWYQRLESIREALASSPGILGVTYGLTMPLEWVGGARCCWASRPAFAGRPASERPSSTHPVTGDYFRLFGIRMLAGDSWTREAVTASPAPAVISEALAVREFGNAGSAVGRSFVLAETPYQVIGVASNTRHFGVDIDHGTAVYVPMNTIPFPPGNVTVAIRTDRTDGGLAAELRDVIWRVEPDIPVPTIRSMAQAARQDAAQRRFDTMLLGTFSVVALVLVAGGLAGTLLYMISLERRSLGVRLALGATPRRLENSVLRKGVGLAAAGVLIGIVGAWNAGNLIESRLYGVEARDLQTLVMGAGVLMVIALFASWIPARRASRTSPMESLRVD